jgi:hypothetical protein
VAAILWLAASGAQAADEAVVPVDLQGTLLVKAATYDRNFAARAGARAVILIVVKGDNVASTRVAAQLRALFAKLNDIGGVSHEEMVVTYSDAASLAELCRLKHASIVFLCPGLADYIAAISDSLSGIDVLTAGAVAEYAAEGVVLAFDLVSGKPKILLNLSQAKKQHVAFVPEAMRLMTVYQ